MDIVVLTGEDPVFTPGSSHIASLRLTNTKGSLLNYTAELYLLDSSEVMQASSGLVSFSLDAGETKDITFPVIMPISQQDYIACIDVYINGVLNMRFVASEAVTVAPPGAYEILLSDLVIHPSPVLTNQPVEISCEASLSGPVGISVTKTVSLSVNGAIVDSKDVTLTTQPYWPVFATISFEFIPESVGTYTIEVDGLSGILEVVPALDYEVIEPILLKSLDYPTDCTLDLTNAEFTVGSEVHVFEGHGEIVFVDYTYHPFSFNCSCNYHLTWNGGVSAYIIAVEESSYQTWLDGLIRDDGHCRQAWRPTVHDYYSTYVDEYISYDGSCDLGKFGQIMLDMSHLRFFQLFDPAEQQSHIMPAGKYRILLWFDLACDRIRSGRLVTDRAYGARIYEIGSATIV